MKLKYVKKERTLMTTIKKAETVGNLSFLKETIKFL